MLLFIILVVGLLQLTFGAIWNERGLLWVTALAVLAAVVVAWFLWAPDAIKGVDLVYSPFAVLIAGMICVHVLVSAALVAYRRSSWHTFDQA